MKLYKLIFPLIFVSGCISSNVIDSHTSPKSKRSVIAIQKGELSYSEKEALIILPGIGDSRKGRRHQKKYFENVGYDLYIPDYIDRRSYEGTIDRFTKLYDEYRLGEYKKVHIFSYILGSYVLNEFINESGKKNIKTIVYNRSPLQERAPRVVVETFPLVTKIFAGKVLHDFSRVIYKPILNDEVNIGVIVENKATPLIRRFKKKAMSYGPIDWNNLDLNQSYDELIYTPLNHDEMYYSFDVVGLDILEFIKYSKFTKEGRHKPYEWDPFEKNPK